MPLFSVAGATLAAGALSAGSSAYSNYQNRKQAQWAAGENEEMSEAQRAWASNEAFIARQFEAEQANKQMNFQEASNAKQMQFQQAMADSAHQREVSDLRRAGLNPILSGTGGMGSATPSGASSAGAMAHASAPSGTRGQASAAPVNDILTGAIGTALNVANTFADVERKKAETKEIEARTPTYQAQIAKVEQEVKTLASQVGLNAALEDKSVVEVSRIYQDIAKMAVEMDLTKQQTRESAARIPGHEAMPAHLRSSAAQSASQAELNKESLRAAETDRFLRKKVGDLEKSDLPESLQTTPLDLIKSILFRFIK